MLASQFTTSKTVVKSLLKSNHSIFRSLIEPSLTAGVSCLLVFLVSCSSVTIPLKKNKKNDLAGSAYKEMAPEDYADHLASFKEPFLATPGIKTLEQDKNTKSYLQFILNDIISNNEIFFRSLKKAQITILDSDIPIHMSLPQGEIFLSKGLISKYMKHESMLVGILAFELVRSEKALYPKDTIIPLGFIPMERMITLSRLSLEDKMEVHKWAHHLTVRSGYDGEYYLSWLQTQNRNTADFVYLVGDANQINREESLFKAFLIKHPTEDNIVSKKNSSKNFYNFLNRIRDGVI